MACIGSTRWPQQQRQRKHQQSGGCRVSQQDRLVASSGIRHRLTARSMLLPGLPLAALFVPSLFLLRADRSPPYFFAFAGSEPRLEAFGLRHHPHRQVEGELSVKRAMTGTGGTSEAGGETGGTHHSMGKQMEKSLNLSRPYPRLQGRCARTDRRMPAERQMTGFTWRTAIRSHKMLLLLWVGGLPCCSCSCSDLLLKYKLTDNVFTSPANINETLHLYVDYDTYPALLAPIDLLGLRTVPFDAATLFQRSAGCGDAVEPIARVCVMLAETDGMTLEPAPGHECCGGARQELIDMFVIYDVLGEAITADAAYYATFRAALYTHNPADQDTFSRFKQPLVTGGNALAERMRLRTKGYDPALSYVFNHLLVTNIGVPVMASFALSERDALNKAEGDGVNAESAFPLHGYSGRWLVADDGRLHFEGPPQWGTLYWLWNLRFVITYQEGDPEFYFALLHKLVVPSVLCHVNESSFIARRGPLLELFMASCSDPRGFRERRWWSASSLNLTQRAGERNAFSQKFSRLFAEHNLNFSTRHFPNYTLMRGIILDGEEAHGAFSKQLQDSIYSQTELKVCGNFCGQGWTGGQNASPASVESALFNVPAEGCEDACCKAHDICCIEHYDHVAVGYQLSASGCNPAFNQCLDACMDSGDSQCMNSGFSIPASTIQAPFRLTDDWCCNQPCPSDSASADLFDTLFQVHNTRRFVDFDLIGILIRDALDRSGVSKALTQIHGLNIAMVACWGVAGVLLLLQLLLWMQHRRLLYVMRHRAVMEASDSPSGTSTLPKRSGNRSILKQEHELWLSLVDIGYTAPGGGARILNNISASVGPGEMIALMGPSGSGKTSLLDVIAGQRRPSDIDGTVHINGHPRYPNSAAMHVFTQRSAYMVQLGETWAPGLTVHENLVYAALLRLPPSMLLAELLERVDDVLASLDISHIANVAVGTSTGSGISGGQKRKLVLGITMISGPSLILLDEPTSGLDSQSAFDVMTYVRAHCDSGRSAIVTIHQPRQDIFSLFSRVALLYRGSLCCFCSPVEAVTCTASLSRLSGWELPNQTNPADLLLDFLVAKDESGDTHGTLLARFYHQASARSRDVHRLALNDRAHPPPPLSSGERKTFYQWLGQLNRGWLALESRMLRNETILRYCMPGIQLIFCSSFMAGLFYSTNRMVVMVSCIFTIATIASNIVPIAVVTYFFADRGSMYKSELTAGCYSPALYLAQMLVHFGAMLIPVMAVYALVLYQLTFTPNTDWDRLLRIIGYAQLDCFVLISSAFFLCAAMMRIPGTTKDDAFKVANALSYIYGMFAGFYVAFDQTTWALRWIFFFSHTWQVFPAMCIVALQDFVIPFDNCPSNDAACQTLRHGNAMLQQLSINDLDHTRFSAFLLLLGRWALYTVLALVLLEADHRGWVFLPNLHTRAKKPHSITVVSRPAAERVRQHRPSSLGASKDQAIEIVAATLVPFKMSFSGGSNNMDQASAIGDGITLDLAGKPPLHPGDIEKRNTQQQSSWVNWDVQKHDANRQSCRLTKVMTKAVLEVHGKSASSVDDESVDESNA